MSTISPRDSNAANRFTPEQKLIFVGRLARLYRRSRDRYETAANYMDLSPVGSDAEKRYAKIRRLEIARCDRLYNCIVAMTALPEPEPTPEPEPEKPKRLMTSIEAARWYCVVCGEIAITVRQDRYVCDEHRAMLDSGVFTMDELLYGDDDMAGGE